MTDEKKPKAKPKAKVTKLEPKSIEHEAEEYFPYIIDLPGVGLINILAVTFIGLPSERSGEYEAIIDGVEVKLIDKMLKRAYLAQLVMGVA